MNENQNEMTSLDAIESQFKGALLDNQTQWHPLSADELEWVFTLAREGLQLREHMIVCGNFIREAKESQDAFHNEHENCKRLTETLSALTAERDDLVIRLAEHKLELGKLDCELEALRKDKERLDKLLAGHKFRAEHHLGYWGHEHQYKQLKSREELDSAMEKDKSV